MRRTVFEPRHDEWRKRVRDFLEKEVVPSYATWADAGHPPRDFWPRAGAAGILGVGVPVEYGGTPETSFLNSAVFAAQASAGYAGADAHRRADR